jgi:uncharacterized protein YjbJ (UPF0337 family)
VRKSWEKEILKFSYKFIGEGRQNLRGKRQKAKGKRQNLRGKRQKAKGKRQKAKGKRGRGKGAIVIPFPFNL